MGLYDQLEDPDSAVSRRWDAEHDEHALRQVLRVVERDFNTSTWLAFQRQALEDANPVDVAAELGMSLDAVYLARTRVLKRLREAGQGLIEVD